MTKQSYYGFHLIPAVESDALGLQAFALADIQQLLVGWLVGTTPKDGSSICRLDGQIPCLMESHLLGDRRVCENNVIERSSPCQRLLDGPERVLFTSLTDDEARWRRPGGIHFARLGRVAGKRQPQ